MNQPGRRSESIEDLRPEDQLRQSRLLEVFMARGFLDQIDNQAGPKLSAETDRHTQAAQSTTGHSGGERLYEKYWADHAVREAETTVHNAYIDHISSAGQPVAARPATEMTSVPRSAAEEQALKAVEAAHAHMTYPLPPQDTFDLAA